MSRDAVFRSWMNDRAIYYRKQNRIPDDLGTAVNVQAMVFGNMGETSATGVGFTRNPATGENHFYGEFLTNAQGEDVVAGVRTPRPIADLESVLPEAFHQLHEITKRLERHYRDIQDFEFTIQDRKLYLLQTRTGKRTAQAAVRIAVDMVQEGMISKEEALLRVEPASLDQLLHPRLDPKHKLPPARAAASRPRRARPWAWRCSTPTPRRSGATEEEGHPGAQGDHARRHPRHGRGAGHPDRDRRHDLARRGGGARDGQALRLGRRRGARGREDALA